MSLLPSRGPDADASQDGELEVVGVDEDVSAVLDALSSETAREILNAVYAEPGTPSELADRLDMSIQKVSYHLEKLEGEELIDVAGTQYSEKGQEMTVYEPPEDPLVVFVGTPDRKRTLRSLIERLVPAVGVLTAASVMVQAVFGSLPGLFGSPDTGTESGGAGANETTATPGAESTPAAEPSGEIEPESVDQANATEETTYNAEGGSAESLNETAVDTPTEESAETATETPTEELTETPTEELTETVTEVAGSGGLDIEPGVAFFLGGLLVIAVVGLLWTYSDW